MRTKFFRPVNRKGGGKKGGNKGGGKGPKGQKSINYVVYAIDDDGNIEDRWGFGADGADGEADVDAGDDEKGEEEELEKELTEEEDYGKLEVESD